MDIYNNNDNMLSVLENYTLDQPDDIAKEVADNFRKRRVEKNVTRRQISEQSGVPISSVARFEQKGLIAFESLVKLAMALGYTAEIRGLFGAPKFSTMAELDQIRQKTGDKRAYKRKI